MKVEMGSGGIAGIPQFAENLASFDSISDRNRDRLMLHMRVKRKDAVAEIEDHMVSVHVLNGDGLRIRQCSRLLIVECIGRVDDRPVGYRKNVGPIPWILVDIGRVALHEPAGLVEQHPVDGEALCKEDAPIAGYAASPVDRSRIAATIDSDPAAARKRRSDLWQPCSDIDRCDGVTLSDRSFCAAFRRW